MISLGRASFLRAHRNLFGKSKYRCYSVLSDNKKILSSLYDFQNARSFSVVSYLDCFRNGVIHTYLNIADSSPILFIEESLVSFHDVSGLSWSAVIISTSVIFRILLMLPSNIASQKAGAKRRNLNYEMTEVFAPQLNQKINAQVLKYCWTKEEAETQFKKALRSLHKQKVIEYNCAIGKVFLPALLQIPIWISFSIAIRQLSTMTFSQSGNDMIRYAELSQEGFFIFSNLTQPDPSFILPLLFGLSMMLNIESSRRLYPFPSDKIPKFSRVSMQCIRFLPIVMVPISAGLPSALTLYWSLGSLTGLAINVSLMSPKLRRIVGIPKTRIEPQNPIRVITNDVMQDITSLTSKLRF